VEDHPYFQSPYYFTEHITKYMGQGGHPVNRVATAPKTMGTPGSVAPRQCNTEQQ